MSEINRNLENTTYLEVENRKKQVIKNKKNYKTKMRNLFIFSLGSALLLGISMAYFTDYATLDAKGTAGTVAISTENNINLLNGDGQDIINPGDMREAYMFAQNEGNKSIDVRTTIAVTTQSEHYDLSFSGDASTQSEYDLYYRSDVEYIKGQGWKPKDGAKPIQVKSIDKDVITYVLPEYSLNGNSDKYDEVETIDGVNAFNHKYEIVLLMKGSCGNDWQDSSVSIDVVVEAKQHENTEDGWEIVDHENITHGSINKDVVKGEDILTKLENQKVEIVDERNMMMPGSQFSNGQMADGVEMIVFTTKTPPIHEYVCDVSANGDGSLQAWQERTYVYNGKVYDLLTLYITAVDGKEIYANVDASYMFAGESDAWGDMGTSAFSQLKFIDCSNLNVSKVSNAYRMFYNSSQLRAVCAGAWAVELEGTKNDEMFKGAELLKGSVSYDASKVGHEMSNQKGNFVDKAGFIAAVEEYVNNK